MDVCMSVCRCVRVCVHVLKTIDRLMAPLTQAGKGAKESGLLAEGDVELRLGKPLGHKVDGALLLLHVALAKRHPRIRARCGMSP